MASCCNCCSESHSVEDLDHLFMSSEIARFLWNKFRPLLDSYQSGITSIRTKLHGVLKDSTVSSPQGFTTLLITMLIVWEIWKQRCITRFEGGQANFVKLGNSILEEVSHILNQYTFSVGGKSDYLRILSQWGLFVHCKVIQISVVIWNAPVVAFALNIDGASKGNPGPAGGGGCFRDCSGKMLLGFSYYYGIGSCIVAEGRALLDGLRLAKLHGILLSIIYTDSKVIYDLVKGNGYPPWQLVPWWSSLKDSFQLSSIPIVHIFREANLMADSLAKVAVDRGRNSEFFSMRELPDVVRKAARADALGIPSLRIRRI